MRFGWLNALEVLSFIFSAFFYKYLKRFELLAFVFINFLGAAADLIGLNKNFFGWQNNYFVFNYYNVLNIAVFFYVFLKMLKYKGVVKSIYLIAGVLCTAATLINLFFIQGRQVFNTYSSILTSLVCVTLSMLLIVKLFTDDEDADITLTQNPYFWIAGGTLIFSIGAMFILGLQQYILANHIQINGRNIYGVIIPILNIFLYASYNYAFILCRKLTNRFSPSSLP